MTRTPSALDLYILTAQMPRACKVLDRPFAVFGCYRHRPLFIKLRRDSVLQYLSIYDCVTNDAVQRSCRLFNRMTTQCSGVIRGKKLTAELYQPDKGFRKVPCAVAP